MSDLKQRDYFVDFDILLDPYPFFEAISGDDGVFHDGERDIYFVTGFDEAVVALLDADKLSSSIAVNGPKAIPAFGQDRKTITEQIAKFRAGDPLASLLVAYDGEEHMTARSLLNRLFTPSRLKANEEYMATIAERMVSDALNDRQCEIVNGMAAPFVTLVVADLLGVPAEDRIQFEKVIREGPPAGNMAEGDDRPANATLIYLGGFFMRYISERRANPSGDVMSELATATLPDGSLYDLLEVVKAAMFLFAAGQDTSAKLVGNSVRYLAEDQDMQARLRKNPSEIVLFIEEMLRLEGSTKITTRLAMEDIEIGGTKIPAGKPVVIALAAANRDPVRWEEPSTFQLDRKGIRQHLAFGRGRHTCIGAALARAEVRILLETLLRETKAIRFDEEHHGPAGARKLSYEPSFIIRGLDELHVKFELAGE